MGTAASIPISLRRLLAAIGVCLLAPLAACAATPEERVDALRRAQAATVGVFATAVDDARSAETLGHRRAGSGVLIDADGLVLTIGYLILEAQQVDLLVDGRRLPARVVAYDVASGFGLLQSLTPLRIAPAPLGDPARLDDGEALMIAAGGDGDASLARLADRRPFSGYWEYHIDGALFTVPARRDHSGAGLFNAEGELLGIGSLFVASALRPGHPRVPGNMFVPVDLLRPILAELRQRGSSSASRRAWIGVICLESASGVEVVRVSRDSPAEEAGVRPGDRIEGVDDTPVASLEAFYKALWRAPPAEPERDVRIVVRRDGERRTVTVRSVDRNTTLRRAQGI